MKTEELLMSGTSEELKIPYVLLERCSLEGINSYIARNSNYGINSNLEQLQPRAGRNSDYRFNSNLGQLHTNPFDLEFIPDPQRLFHSYVLLERLSPNVIENLSNKKEE